MAQDLGLQVHTNFTACDVRSGILQVAATSRLDLVREAQLCLFPAFLASRVVRSWCGAWFTSHRTQGENTLACPLGCEDAVDSQRHFMYCVPFWAPCSSSLGIEPASDVFERGGYSLTPRFLFALAVLCKAYHGIRREPSWIQNTQRGHFELNKGLWALGVGASFRRFAGIDLSRVLPVDRLVA